MSTSLVHASCVALGAHAALLIGPSGSGKSDLALRFLALDDAAQLVADDQVDIERQGDRLFARAPDAISGLLEVRGLGLWRVAPVASAELALIVNLVPRDAVPRLPESQFAALMGVELPSLAIHAFDASAPIKLRVALRTVALLGLETIQKSGFPDKDGKFG